MNNNVSALYSWPVIILITILFWPVGIYLIFKRVSMDRQAAMGNGKIVKMLGIGLLTFAVLGLIACADSLDVGTILVILFFGLAGLSLIGTAGKIKNSAEDIRRYLAIVVNGGKRELKDIASAVKKPYDVVRTDLQMMIDKGYLKGAYIDDGKGVLVLPVRQQPMVVQAAAPLFAGTPMQQQEQPKKWVVQCQCCGANNMISGDVGVCEYCGSPIGKR